ncbi:hypothetical protein EDD18DRAFT_1366708 [Armillaria luteobubalina]|uniref:Uncharacterized protein n=1 Tax=Armillaria luteobubalina TaxID=153913 RepID=A0AA39P1U4_9AGAR|nr:hypothetical protein EDD18DRAFT_1366708 [Armillaria luteobubalina]
METNGMAEDLISSHYNRGIEEPSDWIQPQGGTRAPLTTASSEDTERLNAHLSNCVVNWLLGEQSQKQPPQGSSSATRKRPRPCFDKVASTTPEPSQAQGKRHRVDDLPSDFEEAAVPGDYSLPVQSWNSAPFSSSPPGSPAHIDLALGPSPSSSPPRILIAPDPTPFGPSPSPPTGTIPHPYPTPLFRVADLTSEFQENMLRYTAEKVLTVSETCVFHTVTGQPLNTAHYALYGECSSGMRSGLNTSHYDVFRKGFKFSSINKITPLGSDQIQPPFLPFPHLCPLFVHSSTLF